MKFTLAILVAAVVYHAEAARIIGGEPVPIERHPSIVQMEVSFTNVQWTQACAGTIISSKYVVSAAHCFPRFFADISTRRFRAGSSTRYAGGVIVYIVRRLNHPNYLPFLTRSFNADISLVELATPLSFGSTIQSVPIPPQGFELPDGLPVIHAGWGDTVEGAQTGTDDLRAVTIYTINRDLCRERYAGIRQTVTDNMICAGILDVGGKDACQGDSGGPLYYGDILVGVVSWGEGCANDTYPGVSTKISSYTNWLVDNAV